MHLSNAPKQKKIDFLVKVVRLFYREYAQVQPGIFLTVCLITRTCHSCLLKDIFHFQLPFPSAGGGSCLAIFPSNRGCNEPCSCNPDNGSCLPSGKESFVPACFGSRPKCFPGHRFHLWGWIYLTICKSNLLGSPCIIGADLVFKWRKKKKETKGSTNNSSHLDLKAAWLQ